MHHVCKHISSQKYPYHLQWSRSKIIRFALEKERLIMVALQDDALLLVWLLGQESCTRGMLKHLTNTLIGLCRTLEVLVSTNLLADFLTLQMFISMIPFNRASSFWWQARGSRRLSYLLGGNRLLAGLVKLLDRLLIVSQILLATDEDNWEAAAEVQDFRDPL
jgi:hypothetical protein